MLLAAPPPADPSAALVVVDGREVPLKDVVALEEIPVDVLAPLNTLVLEPEFEFSESADVEFTLEAAVAVLTFPEARADVEDTGAETPAVGEGDSKALPGEGALPAPAPDDDPAVFETGVDEAVPVKED